jgi:hypothetical protein
LSIGAFVQNWTSFGGSGNRRDTKQMNLQPFGAYFLPNGWSIGYSGNILANWKADKYDDIWTVPLGLILNKVVKLAPLPVKLGLAGQYMVHHPDTFGQKWNIQSEAHQRQLDKIKECWSDTGWRDGVVEY